jgi:hypothetical protein
MGRPDICPLPSSGRDWGRGICIGLHFSSSNASARSVFLLHALSEKA